VLFKNYPPLILLASIVVFVGCGGTSEIRNYQNTPIKSASGSKNMNDIRQAILSAGIQHGWKMRDIKQGLVVATKFSTGHMAKVDINYTTEHFNITYKDSSNFSYDGTNIQPTYNQWVKSLHKRISKNISKM